MAKLSLASRSYSPIRLPGALSKVLSRAKTCSISMPDAIGREIEDVDADIAEHAVASHACVLSRHSHWLSVRQSPQAFDTSQLWR